MAGGAEIEELARIWTEIFAGCRFRRQKKLANIFAAPRDSEAIFTAIMDKRIIGFVHLQAGKAPGIWYNRGIGVLPGFRRLGVGRKLLQAAIDFSRSRGAAAIISHTARNNGPSLALHHQLGFKEDFPPPGRRPELSYRLRLDLDR